MTRKRAIRKSLPLWIWLFKHPGNMKDAWPWIKISGLGKTENKCFLCELYHAKNFFAGTCSTDCPLMGNGCGVDYSNDSFYWKQAYYKWVATYGEKRYSAHIAWVLRKALKDAL